MGRSEVRGGRFLQSQVPQPLGMERHRRTALVQHVPWNQANSKHDQAGHDDGVIEMADHWNEVGNEVDRRVGVGDGDPEQPLRDARSSWMAQRGPVDSNLLAEACVFVPSAWPRLWTPNQPPRSSRLINLDSLHAPPAIHPPSRTNPRTAW